ncbi:MAG TPA: energy transducer TonB [Puia sp.]|jgi:protein TonB
MKKIILFQIVFLFQFCIAQENETVTYVNKKGEEVKEKKAVFLIQKLKLNNKLWEFNTYEIFGPMLTSIQTKDETGSIKNGVYISYTTGIIDTIGYFKNNQKDSTWRIFTHNVNNALVKELEYKNDKLISEKDSTEINKQRDHFLDSIKANKTSASVEIESSYISKDSGWSKFLIKNFRYPDRAINKEIQGKIIIEFIVNKEGKIENAIVEKSVEYSLDTESLRIIHKSDGDWIAAVQNGRNVKSYKRQPFEFRLQIQK